MTRLFAAAIVLLALVAFPLPSTVRPPSKRPRDGRCGQRVPQGFESEQRSKATFGFDDGLAIRVPLHPRARKGLPIKESRKRSASAAHAVAKRPAQRAWYTTATTNHGFSKTFCARWSRRAADK